MALMQNQRNRIAISQLKEDEWKGFDWLLYVYNFKSPIMRKLTENTSLGWEVFVVQKD